MVPEDRDVSDFRRDGFIVFRQCVDARALGDEVDRALADGIRTGSAANESGVGAKFRYVPVMGEKTPVSLALVDALAALAARLIGGQVIPTRAKGTRYAGGTSWHRDSDLRVTSLGFAAYLEPLGASNGALRVIRGSHRATSAVPRGPDAAGQARGGEPLATQPGDVIAFDEHLWHASTGGGERRQWRVDYIAEPVSAAEEAQVRAYFAGIFPLEWDGGYDVDRYPSYSQGLRGSDRPWVRRLDDLGVFDLADREEAWVRARRPA